MNDKKETRKITPHCPKCGQVLNAETIVVCEEKIVIGEQMAVIYCLVCSGCEVSLDTRIIMNPAEKPETEKSLIQRVN